eukprot:14544286-Ditylum_brightwellii.AAC.1
MTAIPTNSAPVASQPRSSYLKAVGSSSASEMYTIMPATSPNSVPSAFLSCAQKGRRRQRSIPSA